MEQMDLASTFSNQPLLTPGYGENPIPVMWKKNKRGKPIDFSETAKGVQPLAAVISTTECTLASGFSMPEGFKRRD